MEPITPPGGGWEVEGFVNMKDCAIYLNLTGPGRALKSFMLPFRNILETTKKSRMLNAADQDIWPPSHELLATCEDVSCWELHMSSVDSKIKATIVDPWKKTYLLTIPGNLLA